MLRIFREVFRPRFVAKPQLLGPDPAVVPAAMSEL
jgi:hypothetical protein